MVLVCIYKCIHELEMTQAARKNVKRFNTRALASTKQRKQVYTIKVNTCTIAQLCNVLNSHASNNISTK